MYLTKASRRQWLGGGYGELLILYLLIGMAFGAVASSPSWYHQPHVFHGKYLHIMLGNHVET